MQAASKHVTPALAWRAGAWPCCTAKRRESHQSGQWSGAQGPLCAQVQRGVWGWRGDSILYGMESLGNCNGRGGA